MKIREDKELARIPVIAFTASSMKEDEKQIRSFSDGYLQKPLSKKKLVREPVRFLSHSASQAGTSQQDTVERTVTPEPLPEISHTREDIFDRKTALERMDGDEEIFEKYIQICLEDIPKKLGKLKQDLEIGKTESVWIHAHTIKSMAGTMGACELYKTALELENAGKDYDYDEICRLFERLGQEYDRFLSVYKPKR